MEAQTERLSSRELFMLAATKQLKELREFQITSENQNVINELIWYFTDNEKSTLHAHKGIMLIGNVGSGKTTLMRIFQKLNAYRSGKMFGWFNVNAIASDYAKNGFKCLENYNRAFNKTIIGKEPNILCFDDLGTEDNRKYYGNEANVMANIICERYEHFQGLSGLITHFTTNLQLDELEKNYGDRAYSRLREMCNFLVLGQGVDSTDWRLK